MKTTAGAGELCISSLYRLFGEHATCLPYDGTDRVYTFRSTHLETAIPLIRLHRLKETLEWLTTLSPWREELAHLRTSIPKHSLVLLLSEYNHHPIWDINRNWADTHLSLVRASLKKTGCKTLVIKGHPRSDGTATCYMQDYLKQRLPDNDITIMPPALSALPIEAISLDLEVAAACSLGSCSLPGDIGIDVPHLTSPSIAATFDSGWVGEPFWAKYGEITQMLIAEGTCQDLDKPIVP